MPYVLLILAIACEVAATSLLKATDGFTRPVHTIACLFGYACAFALLAHVVRSIPTGTAYAMWSALGTAVVVTVGIIFLGEAVTPARLNGGLPVHRISRRRGGGFGIGPLRC